MSDHAPRPCPGPLAACMRSSVVAAYGTAIHYGGTVTCVACGRPRAVARWSPDAVTRAGETIAGHLCRTCDPLSPTNRRKP